MHSRAAGTQGRKDVDQWAREGNRNVQGRGVLLGSRPLTGNSLDMKA